MASLNIAMVGTRGVPATYSGFETCVEQLGTRLVARGHQVSVYCRPHHIRRADAVYKGMRRVWLPTVRSKYLDTITHTFVSVLHGLFEPYDVVLVFIVGNGPLCWLPRLRGQKVAINVDGLDWKRQKWPPPAKAYLRWSERLAARFADVVVTDSRVVQKYYLAQHGARTEYIPYGASVSRRPPGEWLVRFGLEPGKYVLFVGRLVPENRVEHLVEAFEGLETDMRCVIVGDAPYEAKYIEGLKANDDARIVFTGYVFGEGYEELCSHAYAFVESSAAGGTHPALLDAMSLGNCVVVNDTAENRETIGNAGLVYSGLGGGAALRGVLDLLIASPDTVAAYGVRAEARVGEYYSWERVTDRYESVFQDLVRR